MMGTHLGATRRPCPRGSSQLGFRSLQQRKGLIWGSRSEEELQTKPPKSRSSEIKTRREGERRTRHCTRVRAFGPVLRGGGSAPAAARSQRPPEKARLSVGASVFALTEPGRGPCLRTFSAQSSEGKSPQSSRRGPRPPSALRASGPLAPWENCLVEVWPEDSHADPRGGAGAKPGCWGHRMVLFASSGGRCQVCGRSPCSSAPALPGCVPSCLSRLRRTHPSGGPCLGCWALPTHGGGWLLPTKKCWTARAESRCGGGRRGKAHTWSPWAPSRHQEAT